MIEPLRRIPRDSGEIARHYANAFRNPTVQPIIHQFLDAIASVNGLDGVAFAIWDEKPIPPSLAVYAILDLKDFGSPNSPSLEPRRKFKEAYLPFWRSIRGVNPRLSPGLSFIDTQGQNLDDQLVRDIRGDLENQRILRDIIFAKAGEDS